VNSIWDLYEYSWSLRDGWDDHPLPGRIQLRLDASAVHVPTRSAALPNPRKRYGRFPICGKWRCVRTFPLIAFISFISDPAFSSELQIAFRFHDADRSDEPRMETVHD
jgi:hypothetical protein